MSEIICTYKLDDRLRAHPMDRGHFYDEQIAEFKKNGKPTRAVGIFNVLLLTERGEVILQKRSRNKRHNPYLIDKTVGGHIQYGDTVFYTAMVECVQELKIPAVVLRENEDFGRTLEILSHSLESAAVLELVDNNIYEIDNFFDGERISIAKNMWLFLGVYGGSVKPMDREASGVLYYEFDVLKDEMKKMPQLFTPDLHFIINKYEDKIKGMFNHLKSK
ncbi:MAG: NUDIX domain-containing protein [Candidatus Magasanikbacteria bacterium]